MNNITTISEIQEALKEELSKNVFFAVHGVPILCENSKAIEYELKSAMTALGITVTITTPSLTYNGKYNGESPFWNIPSLVVTIVENPTTNRGRANSVTALDAALQVAETISLLPNCVVNNINQSTINGLVVVNVSIRTDIGFRYEKTRFNKLKGN